MIDPHAPLYQWVERQLAKDAVAHLPTTLDILTGTTENVPELTPGEQYTLVYAIAQAMKDAETRVNEPTWIGFCNHVGNFMKAHFTIEMQAHLYHVMAKKLEISFTKMRGTVLSRLCSEIKDVLRKTI